MIQYIVTVVMGTVIGYGTNYVAVKMLFRPKKEVKAFGRTLPFTPGVIPKQKDKLAHAVGNAVGTSLLTKEDIKSRLTDGELKTAVTDKLTQVLSAQIREEIIHLAKLDDEGYAKTKDRLSGAITKQILKSVNSIGVGERISDETSKALMEKISGNMLKYVISEELVKQFTDHVGKKVQEYIDDNGETLILAEVGKRLDTLEECTVTELLSRVDITDEKIQKTLSESYDKLVDKAVDSLLARVDIAGMIEAKIVEMDVDTLEELTLRVMKDQLDTIINLGALIGFALSMINVGISILTSR